MKTAFLILILLLAFAKTDDDDYIFDDCEAETYEECLASKPSLEKYKCCWLESNVMFRGCYSVGRYKLTFSEYKAIDKNVTLDCSGRYLFSAALLSLLLLF